MQQGSLPVSRGGTRAFILDSASKEFEETRKTVTSNSCLQSNSTNISPRVITFSSLPFFPPFCIIPLASTVTDNKRKLRENLKRFDQIFWGIAMRDKGEERRWASAKYFQSPSWTRKVGRCRGILPPPPPGYLLTTYESFPDQWNNKVPPNFPTILSFFRPHLESFVAEKRGEEEEEGRNGVIGRWTRAPRNCFARERREKRVWNKKVSRGGGGGGVRACQCFLFSPRRVRTTVEN